MGRRASAWGFPWGVPSGGLRGPFEGYPSGGRGPFVGGLPSDRGPSGGLPWVHPWAWVGAGRGAWAGVGFALVGVGFASVVSCRVGEEGLETEDPVNRNRNPAS